MNINKVMLVGNLTRDPELTTFDGGNCVCKVGLATNRKWKNKEGEDQSEVTFHNLVIWGKRGGVVEKWMKKGDHAYFEGYLKNNDWEDKEGNKRSKVEVVVDVFEFGVNPKKDQGEKKEKVDPLADI